MINLIWGLLGPEHLASERRTRTLGLGIAVRTYNDLAVPNLGGVRFTKNVYLACLGIHIAEEARERGRNVTNIQVSNAIEALACWLSYENNGWNSDERLRGNTKLNGKKELSFKTVSNRDFYVQQPMRMATVQTLPGLNLVESKGERFNSYSLSEHGSEFVQEGLKGYTCYRRKNVGSYLVDWVCGIQNNPVHDGLYRALSPLNSLPQSAKGILKERLISGNHENDIRRRNALSWVSNINNKPCTNWDTEPHELSTSHWKDIKSGAHFFQLRDKAMLLLDTIETQLANSQSGELSPGDQLTETLEKALETVKSCADSYINLHHDPSPSKIATTFAKECLQNTSEAILNSIVERDNQVVKLRQGQIVKGPAFNGEQKIPDDDDYDGLFPKGTSYRLWNLNILNIDFNDQLEDLLESKRSDHE